MAQQPKYDNDLINNHQNTWKLVSVFSMGYMGTFKIIFRPHFQISGSVSVDLYDNTDFHPPDITLTILLPLGLRWRHCLPADCKLNMGATVNHRWYYNSRCKHTWSNLQRAEYSVNTLQVKRITYIRLNKDKNTKIICRIYCFRRHICTSSYKIPKFQRLLVDALKKNVWWQKLWSTSEILLVSTVGHLMLECHSECDTYNIKTDIREVK
jgi:hypothetical protein